MSVLRFPVPGTFERRLVGVELLTGVGSKLVESWLTNLGVGRGAVPWSDFEMIMIKKNT